MVRVSATRKNEVRLEFVSGTIILLSQDDYKELLVEFAGDGR